ncbi:hypothetical protein U1Q18_050786 [Sarracenia purpurea var. burkii]
MSEFNNDEDETYEFVTLESVARSGVGNTDVNSDGGCGTSGNERRVSNADRRRISAAVSVDGLRQKQLHEYFTADLAREMEDRDLAPPEAKVSKVEVMTDAPSATSSASSAENYVNAIKEEEWFTTFSLYKISTEIWQEWRTSVKRLFTEQSTSFASTKTISTPSTTAPTRITNAGANVSQIYDNVSAGTSDVLFPVVSSSPYCVILYGRFVISNVLCVLFAVEYTVKRWTHTIVYFESKERRIIFCEIGDYKRRHGREIGSIPLECNFEQRKICLVKEATYRSCVQVPADVTAVKELQLYLEERMLKTHRGDLTREAKAMFVLIPNQAWNV